MAPWCLFCIPRREASAESLDGAPAPRMPAHTSMRAHLSPPPLCIQRRAPPCRKALDPGDGRRDGLARPRLTRLVEAWWGGGACVGGCVSACAVAGRLGKWRTGGRGVETLGARRYPVHQAQHFSAACRSRSHSRCAGGGADKSRRRVTRRMHAGRRKWGASTASPDAMARKKGRCGDTGRAGGLSWWCGWPCAATPCTLEWPVMRQAM